MNASDDQPSKKKSSSADGHRVNALHRLRDGAPFRAGLVILIELFIAPPSFAEDDSESFFHRLWHGCALLGFLLVFVIEIFIVPRIAPLIAPLFEDANNSLSNLPIQLAESIGRLFGGADSVGYTFVDIDDETFSDWRTPSGHTNRLRIKELIEQIVGKPGATDYQPAAIVVDIDLSDTGTDKDQDNELRNYVIQYSNHKNYPPLIFVHSLRVRPQQSKKAPLGIVDSILMGVESNGPVYFGSSGFLRSADGKVRSWLLAEPTCNKDHLTTIPSVELLLFPIRGKLKPDYVNQKVNAFFGDDCNSVKKTPNGIQLGDRQIQLSPTYLQDRIVYTMKMPPEGADQQLTGDIRYSKARLVLVKEDERQKAKNNNLFLDRIVVVGGSNEESRDIYSTPSGVMPGALVIINAIKSLRTHYQFKQFGYGIEKLIGVIIGIIIWIILERFRVEMGLFVCLGAYVFAVILSGIFLYYGIWFGVSGMVAGTLAHFFSKLLCNIGRDINWRRALLAKES